VCCRNIVCCRNVVCCRNIYLDFDPQTSSFWCRGFSTLQTNFQMTTTRDHAGTSRAVLQCIAVRCSVLQCVAECCSVLQRVCRRRIQWVMLQRQEQIMCCVAVCCSVLRCVAVCCNALQCSALQCVKSRSKRRVSWMRFTATLQHT